MYGPSIVNVDVRQYTKKGIPFRMRNAVDPNKPQVIMPFKYLDEVKTAPQNRLSFPLFSRLVRCSEA